MYDVNSVCGSKAAPCGYSPTAYCVKRIKNKKGENNHAERRKAHSH